MYFSFLATVHSQKEKKTFEADVFPVEKKITAKTAVKKEKRENKSDEIEKPLLAGVILFKA